MRIVSLIFLFSLLFLPVGVKRLTQGVRLEKMRIDFPFHPEWETGPIDTSILNQSFRFLGKGAQCYVFASQDDQYVLKIYRFDRPSLIKRKKINKNALRLMEASKLAFELAKEETGLVYLHLNLSEGKLPTIQCKDPIGRKIKIPLDRVRFALQKKGEPFRSVLIGALQKPDEMRKRIDSFLTLLRNRTAKGIGNSDPNLSRNFGFLGERAIEFDFGNYYLMQPGQRPREIQRYTERLRRWLKKEAPEWVSYLDQELEILDKPVGGETGDNC